MPNLEETIRERAYHLWIADGQPEGQADIYWLNAQREILTTSLEGSEYRAHGFGIGHAEARKKGEGHPLRKKQNPCCSLKYCVAIYCQRGWDPKTTQTSVRLMSDERQPVQVAAHGGACGNKQMPGKRRAKR